MKIMKSKEWWKEHYDNWLQSKLSIREYSNNNNIKKSTFYGWIRKLRKEGSEEKNSSSMTQWASLKPVTENISGSPKEPSYLKIVIGKAIVEIESDFDSDLLSSVVRILKENA